LAKFKTNYNISTLQKYFISIEKVKILKRKLFDTLFWRQKWLKNVQKMNLK